MKKFLALILAVVTVSTLLVACATNPEKPDETTPAPDQETQAPGSNDSETNFTDLTDNTVADLDAGVVKILAWEDAENLEFEFVSSDVQMTAVNEAIFERNKAVEKRLNCSLMFTYTKGNYNNINNFLKRVEAIENGTENDFMDIYAAYSMTTATLSTNGFCANLMKLQSDTGLNFNKPWWPSSMVEEGMFGDKLYICTGDISTNLLWMMETLYFNKELLDTYGFTKEELYDHVNNGTWTLDVFFEYVYDTYSDTDADNAKSAGDTYGYTFGTWTGYTDDFYVGCGFKFFERDASGALSVATTLGGEKEHDLVTRLVDFTYEDDVHRTTNDPDVFLANRAMFTNNRAAYARKISDSSDVDYGILPMPKYDTIQENYSTNIGFPHTLYAVAAGAPDRNIAGTVLQSMAAQSYEKITPVLFEETLQLRYSPENSDAEMFDILKDRLCFDVGRMYCKSVEDYSWSLFRNAVNNQSTAYTTQIAMIMKKINGSNGYLATLVDQLTKADN